jgi:hypothetical protein
LKSKYYIDSISDKIEGFEILLTDYDDKTKKILITFKNSIDAYRSTDESFRLKSMDTLNEIYGSKFYQEWTFFKIEKSTYIQWLSEQSYGIIEMAEPIHFCIADVNSFLDIVTTYRTYASAC